MIDLTTRSGKYRIVEGGNGTSVFGPGTKWLITIAPSDNQGVLLELCTELEELRALAREAIGTFVYVDNGKCSVCHGYWPKEHRPGCIFLRAQRVLGDAKEPAEPPIDHAECDRASRVPIGSGDGLRGLPDDRHSLIAEPPLPLGHEYKVCNVPGCGTCGKCQHSDDGDKVCGQSASAHERK